MGHMRHQRGEDGTRRIALPGLLLGLGLLTAGCAVRAGDGMELDKAPASVSVLGTWTGPELDAFRRVVAPFEADTGISVVYTRTTDLAGEIDRRIAIG